MAAVHLLQKRTAGQIGGLNSWEGRRGVVSVSRRSPIGTSLRFPRSDATQRVSIAIMGDVEAVPNRGALVGAMISGMFGLAWTQWGAAGVSGAASGAIRVAGILIGLGIFFSSARLRRSALHNNGSASSASPSEGSGSMFSSPTYRLVVALEVVALLGGAVLLGAMGHREYIIAWFATVIGIHFLAFGRLFWAGFYGLGTALIAAGIAGAITGFAGGGLHGIEAVSGLIAAASLFVAGGGTVVRAQADTRV